MNAKWKQQAIENQNKVKDMLHSVELEYSEQPDKLLEILRVGTSFYQYSLNNMKLIYLQKPDATYIQSFEAWKKMGISVLKGQKGIKIFVPVRTTVLVLEDGTLCSLSEAKAEQKELYHRGLVKAQSKISYKIGNVFDISQTNFPEERRKEIIFEETQVYDSQELLQRSNNLVEVTPDSNKTFKELFENVCTGIILQIHLGMEVSDKTQESFYNYFQLYERELCQLHPEYSQNEIVKIIDDSLTVSFKEFRNYISDKKNEMEEPEIVKSQKLEDKPVVESVTTVSQANYKAIMEIASDVLMGKVEYAQYDAGEGFDKLSIEQIGPNMIAMAHRFEKNGDLLADPDMEFEVNHEKETLNARTYQNDLVAKYTCVIRENGSVDTRLEDELNKFAKTWLRNIKMQGYKLVTHRAEIEYFTVNLGGTGIGEDKIPIVHNDVESALNAYLVSDRDGKKLGVRVNGKDIVISEFDMASYKNNYVIPEYLPDEIGGNVADELRTNMQHIREKLYEDNMHHSLERTSSNISAIVTENDMAICKQYTFEVVECSEYPSIGKIYSGILNVDEALHRFETVMEKHSNMLPGINLVISTNETSREKSTIPLSSGRNIDLTMYQYYPDINEDRTAREKIEDFVKKAKESGFQTYGKYSFAEQDAMKVVEMNHRRRRGR